MCERPQSTAVPFPPFSLSYTRSCSALWSCSLLVSALLIFGTFDTFFFGWLAMITLFRGAASDSASWLCRTDTQEKRTFTGLLKSNPSLIWLHQLHLKWWYRDIFSRIILQLNMEICLRRRPVSWDSPTVPNSSHASCPLVCAIFWPRIMNPHLHTHFIPQPEHTPAISHRWDPNWNHDEMFWNCSLWISSLF